MKTIYIGFSKSNLIGSKLISWFLNREYSHTYFKFQEPWYDDKTINQSTGHGIGYMAEHNFIKNNTIVKEYVLDISDELFLELVNDCHKNAGVKYGYFQNLGIFVIDVLSKLKINIKRNPINDGVNCSEWMYYILEEVYGKWTDKDPNLVTPADVEAFLQSKNLLVNK